MHRHSEPVFSRSNASATPRSAWTNLSGVRWIAEDRRAAEHRAARPAVSQPLGETPKKNSSTNGAITITKTPVSTASSTPRFVAQLLRQVLLRQVHELGRSPPGSGRRRRPRTPSRSPTDGSGGSRTSPVGRPTRSGTRPRGPAPRRPRTWPRTGSRGCRSRHRDLEQDPDHQRHHRRHDRDAETDEHLRAVRSGDLPAGPDWWNGRLRRRGGTEEGGRGETPMSRNCPFGKVGG